MGEVIPHPTSPNKTCEWCRVHDARHRIQLDKARQTGKNFRMAKKVWVCNQCLHIIQRNRKEDK